MPKKRPKSVELSPPKYSGTEKYIYVVDANIKEEFPITIKRARWKTGHYHLAARNPLGQFIATKRWHDKKDTEKFVTKYKTKPRRLTISSPKKYDMGKDRNRKIIFNKIREKYRHARADIKHDSPPRVYDVNSMTYSHRYNANTGLRE